MLEHLTNKKKAVFCIFLIVGTIVVLIGFGITIKGYLDHENASSNPLLHPIPKNQIKTPQTIQGSLISPVDVEYQTNDGILSANYPFNYTITALVNNTNQFDKIEAYPWTVVDGMALPTTDGVMLDKKNDILHYDYIVLNKDPQYSNAFVGSKINYVVPTERNLGFFLIPYTNGIARGGIFISQQDPLIIHTQVDELQAQTDRDIQKQNIDSTESNAYVFGLTVVIIGFILIGLPLEFIVHGWLLKEDKKDNTNSKLDETPNYYHDG